MTQPQNTAKTVTLLSDANAFILLVRSGADVKSLTESDHTAIIDPLWSDGQIEKDRDPGQCEVLSPADPHAPHSG